jgi:hypothetical protein
MGEGIITPDAAKMSSIVIERKVKGGKLFRLRINEMDEAISVQLTGDFFLDPDEGMAIIEQELADCLRLTSRKDAEHRLAEAIDQAGLRIMGFGVVDIIDALWEAKS